MKIFKAMCFILALVITASLISCKTTTCNGEKEDNYNTANFTFSNFWSNSTESKTFVKKLLEQLSQKEFKHSVITKSIPITFLSKENLDYYQRDETNYIYIQVNNSQNIVTIASFTNKKNMKIIKTILRELSKKYPQTKMINGNVMPIKLLAFGQSFKGQIIGCYNQSSKTPSLGNIVIIIPVHSKILTNKQHIWVKNIECRPSIARKLEIRNNNDGSKTIIQPLYITYDSFKKNRNEILAETKNFVINYKVKI